MPASHVPDGKLISSKLRFSFPFNHILKVKSDINKLRRHFINIFPQDELFILENRVKLHISVFMNHQKRVNCIFNSLFDLTTNELVLKTFDGLILSNKSHIVENKLSFFMNEKDEKVIFEFTN